jgi:tRNA A37 methylthiotransferase MiaB
MKLQISKIGFDIAFVFTYSPRPDRTAVDVPHGVAGNMIEDD